MKKTFSIKGMNCNSCATLIERDLKDKVNSVSASYAKETAEIDFDESRISEDEIKDRIKKLGYESVNKNQEKNINGNYAGYRDFTQDKGNKSPDYEVVDNEETSGEEDEEIKILESKLAQKKEEVQKKRVEEREKSKKNANKEQEKEEHPLENEGEGFTDKIGLYVLIGSIILLLFVVYYFFFRNMQLPDISIPELGDKTSLLLLFAAGILTGFHCISMCGGFVVSYTAKNALNGHKSFKQHLVYGGSKVISYTIMGGIFGLIGGVFAFSIGLRSWVAVLAGLFMIFYALSMFGLKFFRKFQFNPKFLTKIASSESNKYKGPYSRPLVTGLLNGLFIACGPLQAMYLYAMGTGSLVSGATSLFAFGLGTLPVMLGFGSLATIISHNTTKKILKISAIIVLILGLIMLNRGLTLMGSSYSFDSIKEKISGGQINPASVNAGTNEVKIENGVQIVNMDVGAGGYSPNSFVLKKGVPVKWNVNVKQLTGCNSELVMNDYNINARLKQGINTFEFTPDKIGTIRFSCGMGMIRGSFIVTETGTASQEEVKAATPPAGMQCGGSGGGGCGCGG
ncbi:MAG: sulfite exporter TauE/SafE family protein [Nanoarchaeota archaeon]|nr:sulfite exporter TauE/SafE family protein [Nanoarchaeota archaeon]